VPLARHQDILTAVDCCRQPGALASSLSSPAIRSPSLSAWLRSPERSPEQTPPLTPATADVLAASITRPLRPQSASSSVGRQAPAKAEFDSQGEGTYLGASTRPLRPQSASSSMGRQAPPNAEFDSQGEYLGASIARPLRPQSPSMTASRQASISRPLGRPQSASAVVGRQPPPKAEVTDSPGERTVGPSMGGARGGRVPSDSKAKNHDDMCIQGRSIGGSQSGPGHSQTRPVASGLPGVNLQQVHYQSMRRMAENRAKMQQERDKGTERGLEAGRRRRPASAPCGGRKTAAPSQQDASAVSRQEAAQAASQPDLPISAGSFANFLASGQWRSATGQVDSNGYPIPPRKPFTSIPGYGGYVPRKASEGIIGVTYNRGNVLARGSWLGDETR